MTQGQLKLSGSLAVIGGGRMGEALINGLLAGGAIGPDQTRVAEPQAARRSELSASYGVTCFDSATRAVEGADIVLLAVKPQLIDTVLGDIADLANGALIISIAAGISCARLESQLPAGTAVVRVMPNTPAMVRSGMSVVSGGAEATPEQVDLVCALFGFVGEAMIIDEAYQDAATAISGSGPAYMALFVDALARAGVRHGLTRDVAEVLAVETMKGTAVMLRETGMHPEQLVDGVSSPGGTTIAAIEQLEAGGLRSAVFRAVEACVNRAKELGNS